MEFELEPRNAYYGTYVDRILTGSLVPNGNRSVVGSVVSGTEEWKNSTYLSDYYQAYTNPTYRSGYLKGLRLLDKNEFFFDSFAPDFRQIYQLDGGKFIAAKVDTWITANDPDSPTGPQPFEENIIKIMLALSGTSPLTASDASNISDKIWLSAFPFESRYSTVNRLTSFGVTDTPAQYEENTAFSIPNMDVVYNPVSAPYKAKQFALGFHFGNNSSVYLETSVFDKRINGKTTPTSSWRTTGLNTTNQFLKGFYASAFELSYNQLFVPDSSVITDYPFVGSCFYFYGFNIFIRGWKYGLYSGIPTKNSSVYRVGKYGQFRDRLEQRLFAKMYDQRTQTTREPVTVGFISGTVDYITASDPSLNFYDSGYYNSGYRSPTPYFDI